MIVRSLKRFYISRQQCWLDVLSDVILHHRVHDNSITPPAPANLWESQPPLSPEIPLSIHCKFLQQHSQVCAAHIHLLTHHKIKELYRLKPAILDYLPLQGTACYFKIVTSFLCIHSFPSSNFQYVCFEIQRILLC